MVRKTTMKRFAEEWVTDPGNMEELFRLMAGGRTLQQATVDMGVPYMCVYPLVHEGGVLQERYEGMLRAKADALAHEALEIADEQREVVKKDGSKFDPDVGRDKLRVETRLGLAERWDRDRYGVRATRGEGGTAIHVHVDRSCGGAVVIGVKAGGVVGERLVTDAEALAPPGGEVEKET